MTICLYSRLYLGASEGGNVLQACTALRSCFPVSESKLGAQFNHDYR